MLEIRASSLATVSSDTAIKEYELHDIARAAFNSSSISCPLMPRTGIKNTGQLHLVCVCMVTKEEQHHLIEPCQQQQEEQFRKKGQVPEVHIRKCSISHIQ